MKNLIYLLISASLIGYHFTIKPGVSYADFFMCILLVIMCLKIISRKWELDKFALLNLGYVFIMLFSSFLNQTFTNTIFINYFRIYFYGCVAYICLFNSLKCKTDLIRFLLFFSLYLIFFAFNTRDFIMLSQESDVSNYQDFTSSLSYGRNNWGFTGLLFIIFTLYLMLTKQIKTWQSVLVLGLSVLVIFLSVSRMSILGALIVFVCFCFIGKKNRLTILFSAVVVYFLVSFLMDFVSEEVLDSELGFINEKMDNASDDFYSTRVYSINILPLSLFYEKADLIQFIFGDGISIQHSIVAQTLMSTGIVGFIYFLFAHINLFLTYLRKSQQDKMTALLIFIFIANDFITNSRFIILVNTLLYSTMCAYFIRARVLGNVKSAKVVNKKNIQNESNFSHRG